MKELTRLQLYKEVWKTPLSVLAPKYKLSDVGLKKICKKMSVPTPPRGYWAKKKSRKKVKKTALPKADKHTLQTWTLNRGDRSSKKEEKKQEMSEPQMKLGINIKVPQKLHKPHDLVENTRKALLDDKPDQYARVRSLGKNKLDVYIGPNSIDRAMKILNALIKGISKLGYEIKIDNDRTYAIIDDEKVQFYMREQGSRKKHIPTEEEKKSRWGVPQWDFFTTGELRLETGIYNSKRCKDKKRISLEEQLNDFLIDLINKAREQKEWKIQWEKERILEEKRKKFRYQKQLQEELEAKELTKLIELSESYIKTQKIYEFIELVKKEADKSITSEEDNLKLKGWLMWAILQADRMNPVNKAIKSIFNSDAEKEPENLNDEYNWRRW